MVSASNRGETPAAPSHSKQGPSRITPRAAASHDGKVDPLGPAWIIVRIMPGNVHLCGATFEMLRSEIGGGLPGLLERFLVDARDSLGMIERMVLTEDFKAASATAHRAKGSSASLGLRNVSAIFATLEDLGRLPGESRSAVFAEARRMLDEVGLELRDFAATDPMP